MGQKDILSKDSIRRLALDLALYLLELPVDPDSLDILDTEQQRIEDRRADLVMRLREHGGEPFLLHIEIQNNNHRAMPLRMLRYRTDIQLSHPGLPLRQCLIYIGAEPLRMADGLDDGPELQYRYRLIDMRLIDCSRLLAHNSPDALVLAILCDFRGRDPQAVVNEIFRRLHTLLPDNPQRLREYIDILEILSDNRDLKAQIKEAEQMLTRIDVERLPSYEIGLERGLERGIERGLERGMERGEAYLLRRLLQRKFGDLPPDMEQRIDVAHRTQLETWSDRLLAAQTLAEVFAPTADGS